MEELGVKVYVVTFDDAEIAQAYVENNQLEWPLLIDAQRELYDEFGMGRASWWALLKPTSIWKYTLLWMRGTRPQKVGSDVHQMGGDVLVAPDGKVRLVYVSKEPHDRPSVDSILALVRDGGSKVAP